MPNDLLASLEERFKELSVKFPNKVGLVHGRMKLAERKKVMKAFAHGDVQLLVATTVVEVGVNVPEATPGTDAINASSASGGTHVPVGLLGLATNTMRVAGVIAARIAGRS